MPDQLPGRRRRLAWTLLGLTVLLLAASVVLGFTGGEAWNQKFATIPGRGKFSECWTKLRFLRRTRSSTGSR